MLVGLPLRHHILSEEDARKMKSLVYEWPNQGFEMKSLYVITKILAVICSYSPILLFGATEKLLSPRLIYVARRAASSKLMFLIVVSRF